MIRNYMLILATVAMAVGSMNGAPCSARIPEDAILLNTQGSEIGFSVYEPCYYIEKCRRVIFLHGTTVLAEYENVGRHDQQSNTRPYNPNAKYIGMFETQSGQGFINSYIFTR
jgi:hypothetical protein